MEINLIPWGDGSNQMIQIQWDLTSIVPILNITSDPNITGRPRSKTICLSTSSDSPYGKLKLTIHQSVGNVIALVFESTKSAYTKTVSGYINN